MKKRTIIMAIAAIFFCFFTGCASRGDLRKLEDASLAQSTAINRIAEKVDQLAAQPTAEPGYDAYKLRQSASQPTQTTGLGQLTMAEVRGNDKEILAAITPAQPTVGKTGQTDQTIEDRLKNVENGLKNVENGVLAHTARLASHSTLLKKHGKILNRHEERFDFIQERLKEAGVLKIEKADGWEFGPYASGSAELTNDMKSFIKDTVNGLKTLAVDLEKKGEKIVLVFKSFTDRDGSKELNERLQKKRSENCRKEFLEAIAAVSIQVETRIIPGENSERSIDGEYDRYTLVMMKKESAIPITAAPAAKTNSPANNPASAPAVKPATPTTAPADPASSTTPQPDKKVSKNSGEEKITSLPIPPK